MLQTLSLNSLSLTAISRLTRKTRSSLFIIKVTPKKRVTDALPIGFRCHLGLNSCCWTDLEHGIRWVWAETAGGGASEGCKNGHFCTMLSGRRTKPLFARPVRGLSAPSARHNRNSRKQQLE